MNRRFQTTPTNNPPPPPPVQPKEVILSDSRPTASPTPRDPTEFGCPYSKDPKSRRSGTGGPQDGTFKNLATGGTETRSNGGNIKDENISRDTNAPGTLSMANTGQPNSGGSQFFINVADNNFLDWFSGGQSKHPVFGKIIDGMDVASAISNVPTTDDCPNTPIMVKNVTISGI